MSNHPHQGKNERAITHARVLHLVKYDPETGIFTALTQRGPIRIGDFLGSVDNNGYRRICLDRKRFIASRLAWFYMTGYWPEHEIDHRDLDRDNNRFVNLRDSTTSQNHGNTGQPRGTNAPLKGAHWNRFRGHWQSYIRVCGKSIRLGRFSTAEEAHAAYMAAAQNHFGEFARAS